MSVKQLLICLHPKQHVSETITYLSPSKTTYVSETITYLSPSGYLDLDLVQRLEFGVDHLTRFNKICHPSQRPRWQVDKEAIGLSRVQQCSPTYNPPS